MRYTLLYILWLWAGFLSAAESYYLVGWLNGWSTTDKSYPLTLQEDGQTWSIVVPAAGNDGWFKIAPDSAYGKDHFFHYVYGAPYDGCRELSGQMVYGTGGAWRLPDETGVTQYTININPETMQFLIVPDGSAPPVQSWSGTLPVLFINTESAVTSRDTYVAGTCYLDALGLEGYCSVGSADSLLTIQMKGRGNYTWNDFDKKPYNIYFDNKVSLLGMKGDRKFTLLAHPDDDMVFLRNTVGFEVSRMLGMPYTPDQRAVEVVLNGDYIGLYMLTEKIRVDGDRVDITKQNDGETDSELITGGWLLEIDNYEEAGQICIQEGNGSQLRFTLHSPDVLSDVQRTYITDFLQATDDAIYQADKSSKTWENYIDIDVLARFYIVQEVMDNAESFHGSCYFSKDRGADTKLKFGPVWDFGNAYHRGYDKFIYQDPPFGQNWIGEIARYPHFQEVVKSYWQSFLRQYTQLDDFIDDFVAQIAVAVEADGRRWPQYRQSNISERQGRFIERMSKKVDFLCQQWGELSGIAQTHIEKASADAWYMLDGRRLNNRPVKAGVYLYQGKKVLIR